MALLIIFIKICRIRSASAETISFSKWTGAASITIPASFDTVSIRSMTSSYRQAKFILSSFNMILPSLICAISSTSLTRLKRCFPDLLIFSRHSCIFAWSSVLSLAITVIPIIAFNGVRISWDMFIKNCPLTLFASSALSSAAQSSIVCALLSRILIP